jgi:hypothetical protein
MSDGHRKLIPINKQPNDQIVHALRFGETNRPAYQPLDPRAQADVVGPKYWNTLFSPGLQSTLNRLASLNFALL